MEKEEEIMLEIQNTLVSLDLAEKFFCCDLDSCLGECCIEGDAGAPITEEEKKKIGIFILRANGFKDNGVDFSREDAAELWGKTICELEDRGYDYELLTSGHFGDEAFLDLLVKKYDFLFRFPI